jgi:hypothetical protein
MPTSIRAIEPWIADIGNGNNLCGLTQLNLSNGEQQQDDIR